MKKFLINIVIGIAICLLAQTYLQVWWIFAPITFLVSLLFPYTSGARSFFGGLLTVFFTWMFLYIFKDMANNSIMSAKMATLFSIKSNYWLFGITSFVMGLIGGSTSLSAYFLRKK